MKTVITYGTFDLFHEGHYNILKRAKELGDYLIVGVTGETYDAERGKLSVQDSLATRIENVRKTGFADKIIVEEYLGQKIPDIIKYHVDIFAIGSDWKGKFDYLDEYCKVVYLDRTEGVSSSEIREKKRQIRLGLIGDSAFLNKVYSESQFVNGLHVTALLTSNIEKMTDSLKRYNVNSYKLLLEKVDAIYIRSLPELHYAQIKEALEHGIHVLCESPITLSEGETTQLFSLASQKNLILMEAIKTAYATAFTRLLLLIKSGKIGNIVSVEATCTSLNKSVTDWTGFCEWAPTALLPVFEILGNNYQKTIITHKDSNGVDLFTKIDFIFEHSVASVKVGDGVKSEGELIISGTNGYIYVPAPWWKTDYFEIRYENPKENKRYFYQLDGEGIRYELVDFLRSIERGKSLPNINFSTTKAISTIMEDFFLRNDYISI